MGTNGLQERRRHGRAKIRLEVILERKPPAESVRLTLLDFSVGGFFCLTTHAIEPGTLLGVTFEFPPYAEHAPRRIDASAVVVRCEPRDDSDGQYTMAACFMDMTGETKEHIQGYVDWYQLVYGDVGASTEGN
jgi:c-di-GMP-binding flagellar brake protein YcgR